MLYSNLTNRFSRDQVFYDVLTTFVAFFALFAFVMRMVAGMLLLAFVDWLMTFLLGGSPLAIFATGTRSSTRWPSSGAPSSSRSCSGASPTRSPPSPGRQVLPLFGLGANVALIFSGLYVRYVSGLRRAAMAAGSTVDPWGSRSC